MRFFTSVYFKIIASLAGVFILYAECVINHNKDLDIFIGASKLIFEGKTCYEVWLHSGTSGLKYFYSPLFAVLLFPLKDLPQVAYNLVWLSLNLVIAYRIIKLLPFFLPVEKLTLKQKQLFYLLIFVTSFRMFYDTFSLGQMTVILVWGSLESMRLIYSQKIFPGAALLALIINIKIIPVALLAYLVYRKEFKAVVYTLLFVLIYLMIPALLIGPEFNTSLLIQWFSSLTATTGDSIMDDYGRQSLSSFIPALLMDTPIQFSLKRNFISLEPQQVNFVLNGFRCLIMLLLAILFGNPFMKIGSASQLFYDIALICLVTPLFFPHQGKYSFFYLLPAQAWCVYSLIAFFAANSGRRTKGALIFFAISFVLLTLTTDGLIGRRLSDLCEYLNFITLGSFCLLIAAILIRPANAATRPQRL